MYPNPRVEKPRLDEEHDSLSPWRRRAKQTGVLDRQGDTHVRPTGISDRQGHNPDTGTDSYVIQTDSFVIQSQGDRHRETDVSD